MLAVGKKQLAMVYRRNSSLNHPITQPACSDTSQAGHPITQSFNHSITHNVGSWQKTVGNGLPS
jgi:hypothetical protein